MCMILKRNKKNVLLYGYTNNRWYHTITRGLTLVLGFWFFYMGLGVGFLATQYKPTQNWTSILQKSYIYLFFPYYFLFNQQ